MNTHFKNINGSPFISKFVYYFKNLCVGLLFCLCIKNLIYYNEEFYQIWKDAAAAKAIIFFLLIIYCVRKPRLVNWQSLVATLAMGAILFFRYRSLIESPDIFNTVKFQVIAEWLSLLLIIDLCLYRNVSNLLSTNNSLLFFYVFFTVGAICRRHNQMGPLMLISPMLLFSLIKMDLERKEWLFQRLIDGWVFSFVFICTKCFIENPYSGEQYYGFFEVPGPFSIFVVCCFIIAIVALVYSKGKYGLRSFASAMCIIWLAACVGMLWIIGTRTSILGIYMCLIAIFMFARNDISRSKVFIRGIIVTIITIFFVGSLFLMPEICIKISSSWLESNAKGILSPVVKIINKFRWMKIASEELSTKEMIYNYLDIFSSKRLSIIKGYSDYFNFDGNGPIGFETTVVKSNYAYSAHNTYIQFLVEYGYLSIFELIILLVIAIKRSLKKYTMSQRNAIYLLPFLWLVSLLGVWVGESNTFFYPITFFGFMFIARLLSKDDTE